MKRGKKMQLSWTMFETQCMDSRGIKLKFEGLCRQLFIYDILSGNHKHLYPHSMMQQKKKLFHGLFHAVTFEEHFNLNKKKKMDSIMIIMANYGYP